MELDEFLRETQRSIREELEKELAPGEMPVPPEEVFTEQVMEHMAEVGITFEPEVCHYAAMIPGRGKGKVKVSGYAIHRSGDGESEPERLDLFVSLYKGDVELVNVPDTEVGKAAKEGLQFLRLSARGDLLKALDQTSPIYPLVSEMQRVFEHIDNIRIFVITDGVVKTRNYAPQDVEGKQVYLEVMDIQRLFNHLQQGRPRDEILVNFQSICGAPLPCVWVPGSDTEEYDYAMTAMPGEALRYLYEKYGPRILEANVRSFLGVSSRGVNKGIRDTLRDTPQRFMAYNNGVVVVADEARLARTEDGSIGLLGLQGLQIVNGGQTTASIFFAKKKHPQIDLSSVRVPAKIIVLRDEGADDEELIANISRFANSQNVVRQSDLSANKPFHREVEKLSTQIYCPDGIGRWFYERSTGSYKVMLEKDASTTAQRRRLQTIVPPARKITKPDLARFLNTWDQNPHESTLGAQKNFQIFMQKLTEREDKGENVIPDRDGYKDMIAKAIIFKSAHKGIRSHFKANQIVITNYTVSLLSNKLGERLNLGKIWEEQAISLQLYQQVLQWAEEVALNLENGAAGRMISEWAKKLECWWLIRDATYTPPRGDIPELLR